jgi:hypothetical protein
VKNLTKILGLVIIITLLPVSIWADSKISALPTKASPTTGDYTVIYNAADPTQSYKVGLGTIPAMAGVSSTAAGLTYAPGTGVISMTANYAIPHYVIFTTGGTTNRTVTFPDQNCAPLYLGGALSTPASGTLTNCTGGTQSLRIPHTFALLDAVDARTFPGIFISLPTGQTAKLASCSYKISGGTSVGAKLTKNGSDATGFTGISVTPTAASTTPTAVTLADGDFIALVTSSPTGSPLNLSFSIFVEYTK